MSEYTKLLNVNDVFDVAINDAVADAVDASTDIAAVNAAQVAIQNSITTAETIADSVDASVNTLKVELDDHTDAKVSDISDHTNTKKAELTTHASVEVDDFDTNAADKLEEYNVNHINPAYGVDAGAVAGKLQEYNANATYKYNTITAALDAKESDALNTIGTVKSSAVGEINTAKGVVNSALTTLQTLNVYATSLDSTEAATAKYFTNMPTDCNSGIPATGEPTLVIGIPKSEVCVMEPQLSFSIDSNWNLIMDVVGFNEGGPLYEWSNTLVAPINLP